MLRRSVEGMRWLSKWLNYRFYVLRQCSHLSLKELEFPRRSGDPEGPNGGVLWLVFLPPLTEFFALPLFAFPPLPSTTATAVSMILATTSKVLTS